MRINTNIGALAAANNLSRVNDAVRNSTEKLSSGFRINKAADDAAGLGVANLFRSDVRALTQAQRNAEQATSVLQIAEGGATGIQKILERMKELAAQAAADAVDAPARLRIDAEFQSLLQEIDRITLTTEFQGSKLLDGAYGAVVTTNMTNTALATLKTSGDARTVTFNADSATVASATANGITQTLAYAAATASTLDFSALGVKFNVSSAAANSLDFDNALVTTVAGSGTFMIGAARNGSANYTSTGSNLLTISGAALKLDTATLKLGFGFVRTTTSLAEAQTSLSAVDSALSLVNTALGVIGAGQNRLASAIDGVKSTILNYQAAESAVRDLDMAAEMVTFSKNQIISQAGIAMLAQANQSGQGVLKLLQ